MSAGGARLFDLGYRAYDGPRRRPAWALVTLAGFTVRRVLGIGRGARHKALPALALAVAYVPALVSVVVAALSEEVPEEELVSYGEYTFFIGSALALFAALVAPEALCPDRRSGLLGLYLAGPLDRVRYVAAKAAAVFAVMLAITLGPLLFMLLAFVVAGYGPALGETPGLLLRILAAGVATAVVYTAVSLGVASFTPRRAAAAVGVVLFLLVPALLVRTAIASAGAPEELDLLSLPFVPSELAYRIFGERSGEGEPIEAVATWAIAAALLAWTAAGATACLLRYRRLEAR